LTEKQQPLGYLCPEMIFCFTGYHTCRRLPFFHQEDVIWDEKIGAAKIVKLKKPKTGFCCCAAYYDVANPPIHLEVNVRGTSVGIVSELDIPAFAKEHEEQITTEQDVPNLCPRHFTLKQIEAKIEPLMERLKDYCCACGATLSLAEKKEEPYRTCRKCREKWKKQAEEHKKGKRQ